MPLTRSLVVHVPNLLEATERIIIIVVNNPKYSEDNGIQPGISAAVIDNASTRHHQPQLADPVDKKIIDDAKTQARWYVKDLMDDHKDEEHIFVSQQQIRQKAREEAKAFCTNYREREKFDISKEEEKSRLDEIREHYITKFEYAIKHEMEGKGDRFPSKRKIFLHNIALQDKKDNRQTSSEEKQILSVIRSIQQPGIQLAEASERLVDIQAGAIEYLAFYEKIDPTREEAWPDQANF